MNLLKKLVYRLLFHFFIQTLGEINRKGNFHWRGNIGFERAVNELIASYHNKNIVLKLSDFPTFYSIISLKAWSEQGIFFWDNLINYTFPDDLINE